MAFLFFDSEKTAGGIFEETIAAFTWGIVRTTMKGITMKLYKKTYVKVEDVMTDDHVKIAGLMYRVSSVTPHSDSFTIQLYSIINKKYTAILTFRKNTLMKIWNQK